MAAVSILDLCLEPNICPIESPLNIKISGESNSARNVIVAVTIILDVAVVCYKLSVFLDGIL